MISLYDSASGEVRALEPLEPGVVSMYVCGPTVYEVPHLGHGRFSLVFDVLRRYLLWSGFDVRYVSNITDVDDNIINRANREGRSSADVVAEYEAVWWDVMDRLGVMRPTFDPHATAYVEAMVTFVSTLVESGAAYVLDDGVYFAVTSVDDYGLLARQSLDSLRSGARVDVLDGKRSPQDFALWKLAKSDEPAWPSPWGPGRPGWHTECVVMATDLLGPTFDIHGGGQDLRFPHHENERAQARAAGSAFARHWVHNGFVEVDGEKMSKSLGNFRTLVDLLAETDARAYRLLVLRAHYRSPIEITRDTTADAERALERLDAFGRRAANVAVAEPDGAVLQQFRAAMDADLDTAGAIALLFDTIRRANVALDAGDETAAAPLIAAAREIVAAVGLEIADDSVVLDAATAALVAARDVARAARDWPEADRLRDELAAMGWTVSDTASGTSIHR